MSNAVYGVKKVRKLKTYQIWTLLQFNLKCLHSARCGQIIIELVSLQG